MKPDINPMQNPLPMHASPRCGAHSRRTGRPCKNGAMANGRCRMHGGKSAGAPKGEANGNYRHGERTKQAKAVNALVKLARMLMAEAADKEDKD
jgi:hypothetical protein